ncbi:MAG: PIN domain-containing protein [Nitrososphaerales archaeon]
MDTNVLIFDTFEDSEFHKEALNGLDSIPGWHIPAIVFHELVWFFRSEEIDLKRTNSKVEEYLTNEKCVFSPCIVDDVRFAASRINNYKNYNDFVVLSVARRLELPLFTFDEDLRKIASKYGVRLLKV